MPKRAPMPAKPQRYLSLAEVAQRLGLTVNAVRLRCFRHTLPHRKLGKRYVIPEQELETFLAALDGCSVRRALDTLGVAP